MTNNFKNNSRNNTSFKTRTCLVSLSISMILSGISGVAVGATTPTPGLELTYLAVNDTSSACATNGYGLGIVVSSGQQPTGDDTIAASPTDTTVSLPGHGSMPITYESGLEFNIKASYYKFLWSSPIYVCNVLLGKEDEDKTNSTIQNSYTGDITTLFSGNDAGGIKPGLDYLNPNASITITYKGCANDPTGGRGMIPQFTCVFNGFTGGTPAVNQITSTQIPETVADIGATYDWKQNPLLDLGNYFQDTTTAANAGEKMPSARIYYSLSLGNTNATPTPQTAQSISQSLANGGTRPLGLEMGTPIQFVTGGESDYRQMLSTENSTLTDANPLSVDTSTILNYCTQAGKAGTATGIYYQCTVNVCACDPSLDTITNPPTPIVGGCKVNGVSVISDPAPTGSDPYTPNAKGLDTFNCPSSAYTPGGTGPVQTSFLLDLITPFRGATVQEIATNNAIEAGTISGITPAEQAAIAFHGMTRFVIPIQARTTSEIPLGQYFMSGTSFLTSSSSVTYAIAGLNSVSSAISSRPNEFTGTITSGTEPLLDSTTASSDWSPIKIIPGQDPATPITPGQDPATPITPAQDGVALSIDTDNLKVDTSKFKPTDGGLYQLTVQATSNGPSNTGATAYQTIYLNISPENTSEYGPTGTSNSPGGLVYTPLKPFNSSWMYLPGFLTKKNVTPGSNTAPTTATLPLSSQTNASATTTPTVCSVDPTPGNSSANQASLDPCTVYSDTLTQLANNGTPIQYLTPDMMWLAYPGSVKTFPAANPDGTYTTSPMNNNFFTDKGAHIQTVLDYFHKNNPNVGVILTSEMDNPVMGDLGTLQEDLPPGQTAGTNFTQMDRLIFSTVLPFIATKTQGNKGPVTPDDSGSYGYNDLLSGLQFDVEPFKNSPEAADYYKRVADILARHGKVLETFAFADAALPVATVGSANIQTASITMAMGPLGIFLPSMYDVGNNTDPTYASTYAANYMPVNTQSQLTPQPNLIDNNCHWSGVFASNYTSSSYAITGTSFPIGAYCNLTLTDTLYNNASLMGLFQQPGGSTAYFTEMMQTYGGHFQMAVPSEGSAENFTAQIVINPVCFPVDERGVAPANGQIPPLDTNVVNVDPYSSVLGTDVCNNPAVGSGIVNVVPGLPSNYVYGGNLDQTLLKYAIENTLNGIPGSIDFSTANPINDASLNAVMPLLEQDLKPGTYYMATDHYCINQNGGSSGFKPDTKYPNETYTEACRYLIFLSNQNNEKSSVSNQFYPNGGTTNSQDAYIQALIGFANGNFDTEFKNVTSVTGHTVPDIGTPATNPANLGMALYAISSESTTGCFVNESHSLKPNCLLALPVTTPLYDPSGANGPAASASHPYTISDLKINNFSTTGYKLTWTLNCSTPPSGIVAMSQLYLPNGNPASNTVSLIDQNPLSCGQAESATFAPNNIKYPFSTSAVKASLLLVNGQTLQSITPYAAVNISDNAPASPNPVWADTFSYASPYSISDLTVSQSPTPKANSYTLNWILHCSTPPSGAVAMSQLYLSNGSPASNSISLINPTPLACGPESATFTPNNSTYPFSPQSKTVSLYVVNGKTLQSITPPVATIPISITK